MKTLHVAALLFAAVAIAPAAETPLNGEWQIHQSGGGRESTQTCTFAQTANQLGGTCSSQGGPVKLSGKVDGNKITWTIKTDSEGGPVTIVYTGTVDSANAMSGTVNAVEFAVEGEFRGTRAK